MRRNREAGQTLVLFAVGLTVLMLAAGLSIDMGYLRYQKRRMQAAADAAAIGGASELNYSDWATAAQGDSSYDGFTDGTNGATVKVNCPPQFGPRATGGDCNSQNYVEVIVSQPQPLFFMKIIPGITNPTISARAVGFSISSCVYTGGGGINTTIYAGMQMDDSGCGIKSGGALSLTSPSHEILSSYIGSSGCTGPGCHAYDPNNPENGGISPYPPQTIVPPSDPFASVSPPSPQTGSCTPMMGAIPIGQSGGGGAGGTYTVAAGSQPFCGGTLTSGTWNFSGSPTIQGTLTIADSANVNFGAGTYTLNGLNITGNNVTVYGDPSGLTLYNASNSLTVCAAPTVPTNATGCPANYSGDSINLTAPSSGTYAGILFYQDRSDSSPAIIVGNDSLGVGTTFLEGALYFPDTQLTFGEVTDGANWQNTYTFLDANSLLLIGTINIGSEYPSTLPRAFTIRQPVLVE